MGILEILEELLALIASATLYIIRVLSWLSNKVAQLAAFLVETALVLGLIYGTYWLGGGFIIAGLTGLVTVFVSIMILWIWKPKRFHQLTRRILR